MQSVLFSSYHKNLYKTRSVKQAELLGAAFTLAAGGQAEVHVGTSGGGVSSELPWNDKKSKGLKR